MINRNKINKFQMISKNSKYKKYIKLAFDLIKFPNFFFVIENSRPRLELKIETMTLSFNYMYITELKLLLNVIF